MNIKSVYIKITISLILICIRLIKSVEVDQIFSPLETYAQNFDDILNRGQIYKNYAIVAASSQGIYTYDINNRQEPNLMYNFKKYEKTSMQSVNFFEYEKDSQKLVFLLLANGDYGICLNRLENGNELICKNTGYIVQHIIQISNEEIISVGQGYVSLFKIDFNSLISIDQILKQNENFINQLTLLYQYRSGSSTSNKCILDSLQRYLYVVEDSYGIAVYDFNKIKAFNSSPLIFHIFYFELAYDMVLTDDLQYLYMIDYFQGIYVTDISNLYSLPTPTLGDLTSKLLYAPNSLPNCIEISKDNNIIYLGLRSYGVQIFDISNKLNPVLLQSIDNLGYAYSISFTDDEFLMMFCNGYILKFYQSSAPNFSNNFPNIFDDTRSNILSLDRTVTVGGNTYFQEIGSPWTIQIDSVNKLIFIAAERAGTQIWSFKEDPLNPVFYFSVEVDSSSNPSDAVEVKGNYMYIGEGWGGVKIYDITDIENPSNWDYVGYIFLSGDSDSVKITDDEQYMVVANGGTGISLVDISDKTSPFEIGYWVNNKPKGSAENVLLNSNQDLVFGSIRNYGLVILDISDKTKAPVEIGEYYSGMCEFTTLSSNEKYIYVSDGTQGITILDISNPTSPKYITSQSLGGFPTKMRMIQYNDFEYLLVTTRDKELLSAINITDVYNPSLFGKYDPGYEKGLDLAYTEDQNYLYMLTDKGLRVLHISNPLNIHTQINKLDKEGNIENSVENGQVFIGEELEMIIVPFGLGRKYQIDAIYYYYNYKIDIAPSWLNFDSDKSLIKITVDKQGLINGQIFQNNLIFTKILLQVDSSLFVDSSIPLTLSDGSKIIDDSIKNGYLTNGKYLTSKFDSNQDLFNFDVDGGFYTVDVLKKIALVFSESSYNIPASFTISGSMFFNPYQIESYDVLQTYSSQIEIIVTILDTSKGLFVQKSYIGATAILTDAQDMLTIKGDSVLAVKNMVQDMRIQNYTKNLSEIKLDFLFDDQINYQQKYQNISFTDFSFLKLHEGVSINEAATLQKQFDQTYAGGEVTIDEDFTFQFQEDSFISPAKISLQYKFQMESEYDSKKYIDLPQDFWLVANSIDRRISGTPPQMKIYTKQRIKVTASDGYSTVDAYFTIKIWNFSIFSILFEIMEYGGPILFVFGVWSYKYYFYRIFCSKKYKYTAENCRVGIEYKKIIPLMQDNLEKGVILFKLLDLKKVQYQYWTEFGDINKDKLISLVRHEALKNPKIISKNEIDIKELQKKDSCLTMVIIGLGAIWVMKNNHKSTYKAFKELENYAKISYNQIDWYKKFVQITYPSEEDMMGEESDEEQLFEDLEQEENEGIVIADGNITGGYFNKLQVKKEIHQNLVKQIALELSNGDKKNEKKINVSLDYQKKLGGKQSIDEKSKKNREKNKNMIHGSYHYHPKNFPILTIYDRILTQFFKQRKQFILQDIKNRQQEYKKKFKKELIIDIKEETQHLQRFNMFLLKECLYATAYGISFEKLYFPAVSRGIGIHQFEYQMDSIMGYLRVKQPSFLQDGYEQCGLKTNQPLPSWLNVSVINGVIILKGVPKAVDKGSYKIEIYHDCSAILQHHKINVQSNKVNKIENMPERILSQSQMKSDSQKLILQQKCLLKNEKSSEQITTSHKQSNQIDNQNFIYQNQKSSILINKSFQNLDQTCQDEINMSEIESSQAQINQYETLNKETLNMELNCNTELNLTNQTIQNNKKSRKKQIYPTIIVIDKDTVDNVS